MTLRRGETLLLTIGIPVVFLVFFSRVSVVSTPTPSPVDFFVPGILALAVMSTAMVSLGIATGFERGYGVLKRLGATPLGRPRLLGAKIATIVAVELVQMAVLLPVGFALGWDPGGNASASVGVAVAAILLGTAAFAGIGLFMAGTLRAEVNLAAANGLYLVLLLLGGMIVPITKLPSGLRLVRQAPSRRGALGCAPRVAGERQLRPGGIVGRAGGMGGRGPAGRRAHLPLGVNGRTSCTSCRRAMHESRPRCHPLNAPRRRSAAAVSGCRKAARARPR